VAGQTAVPAVEIPLAHGQQERMIGIAAEAESRPIKFSERGQGLGCQWPLRQRRQTSDDSPAPVPHLRGATALAWPELSPGHLQTLLSPGDLGRPAGGTPRAPKV